MKLQSVFVRKQMLHLSVFGLASLLAIGSGFQALAVAPQCRLVLDKYVEGRHGPAKLFPESEIVDQASVTAANRRVINELATTGTKAEQYSGEHQKDLDGFLRTAREKVTGVNKDALYNGMADSDKGKHSSYKKLLTESSPASDALLAFCKGEGAGGPILREILKDAGLGDAVLLNPTLTNAQLRELFQKVPGLQGFLHEIPGMADALTALEVGALSRDQFKAQIRANLFHNGPGEGFWKLLAEVFMPGAMRGAGYDPAAVFSGTVFGKGEGGKLSYPMPVSAEGVVHTVSDRLSQGTTGGVIKIYYEIIGFSKPLQAIAELLVLNPQQTTAQFDALAAHVPSLVQRGAVSAEQGQQLLALVALGKARLATFGNATKQALRNYDQLSTLLAAKQPIEEIVFDGQTYRANDLLTPEAKEAFIVAVAKSLRRLEATTGNPMGPVQ